MSSHILSVQSHVTRDYVGNRAGALALQFLGREVDVINTVSFSSMFIHHGPNLKKSEFDQIIYGLEKAIINPRGNDKIGVPCTGDTHLTRHDIPIVISGKNWLVGCTS